MPKGKPHSKADVDNFAGNVKSPMFTHYFNFDPMPMNGAQILSINTFQRFIEQRSGLIPQHPSKKIHINMVGSLSNAKWGQLLFYARTHNATLVLHPYYEVNLPPMLEAIRQNALHSQNTPTPASEAGMFKFSENSAKRENETSEPTPDPSSSPN